MAVMGGVAAAGTTGTRSLAGTAAEQGQLGKDDFLKLLLAQLKNQDPMKPMDDMQFVSQMAQFNTLERLMDLDRRMEMLLKVEQLAEAKGLIGKEVEATGSGDQVVRGRVDRVKMVDGNAALIIDGKAVGLSDVVSVSEREEAMLAEASSLIGKEVEVRPANSSETMRGIVDSLKVVDGGVVVVMGSNTAKLTEVVSVAGGIE